MPFVKGQPPANPGGRGANKPWKQAIEMALKSKNPHQLREVAEKLVDLAMNGDLGAMKEIGDRMDGKAAQAIIGGAADDPPVKVTQVELVGVIGSANGEGPN